MKVAERLESAKKVQILEFIFLTLITLLSGFVIIWVFNFLKYGFDFSDESFYIIWVARPEYYSDSVTLFGFIYHPIYKLLSGDIVLLRQLNIASIYVLSSLNCYLLFASSSVVKSHSWYLKYILTLVLPISCFSFLQVWLPFPSYNSLNFQGLLLISIGFLLFNFNTKRFHLLYSSIVVVGAWLVFCAKPTSFLLLCAVIFTVLLSYKNKWRVLLSGMILFIITLSISVLTIDGSFTIFIQRYTHAFEYMNLLDSGHGVVSLLKLQPFFENSHERSQFICFVLVFFVSVFFLLSNISKQYKMILLNLFIFLGVLFLVKNLFKADITFSGKIFFSQAIFVIIYFLFLLKVNFEFVVKDKFAVSILFLLLILPFSYSFGTGNNFWLTCSFASFFWVLAGIYCVLVFNRQSEQLTLIYFLVIFQILISSMLILKSIHKPYRQPEGFFNSSDSIFLNPSHLPVTTSKQVNIYIKELLKIKETQLTPGNFLLDFTGHSPGVSFILGMLAPGRPWILGGYPGSIAFAKKNVSELSCDTLAHSWLLVERSSPISIPVDIIEYRGLEFPEHYVKVAELMFPSDNIALRRIQELYKPVSSSKIEIKCKSLDTFNSN